MSVLLSIEWTVAACAIAWGYSRWCRTRAYLKVIDFIEECHPLPVSALEIHTGTGVSIGWVYVVCDELSAKGLIQSVSLPAGHLRSGRSMRLVSLAPARERETCER